MCVVCVARGARRVVRGVWRAVLGLVFELVFVFELVLVMGISVGVCVCHMGGFGWAEVSKIRSRVVSNRGKVLAKIRASA